MKKEGENELVPLVAVGLHTAKRVFFLNPLCLNLLQLVTMCRELCDSLVTLSTGFCDE
jgi:hypothetical protein